MGDYDTLKDPSYITPGWDHICFTNNPNLKSDFFKVILVKDDDSLGNVKLARKIKINFHKYVGDYDLSVYLDGHIQVIGNLDCFVKKYFPNGENIDMSITDHPSRSCIYKEAYACAKFEKDDKEVIKAQMDRYKEEGCPKNVGLVASGVMIRKHGKKNLERHCELWWQEVKNNSRRDQLSFNYVLWKHKLINVEKIIKTEIRGKKGNYIKKRSHG